MHKCILKKTTGHSKCVFCSFIHTEGWVWIIWCVNRLHKVPLEGLSEPQTPVWVRVKHNPWCKRWCHRVLGMENPPWFHRNILIRTTEASSRQGLQAGLLTSGLYCIIQHTWGTGMPHSTHMDTQAHFGCASDDSLGLHAWRQMLWVRTQQGDPDLQEEAESEAVVV